MSRIGFWIESGSYSDVRIWVRLRYSFMVRCGDDDGDFEGSGQGLVVGLVFGVRYGVWRE